MRRVAVFVGMTLLFGGAYESIYAWLGDASFSFRNMILRGTIFAIAVMLGAIWIKTIRGDEHG